jgi:hypothetical protein
MDKLRDDSLRLIVGDIQFNLQYRYSKDRKSSKVFQLERILNPFTHLILDSTTKGNQFPNTPIFETTYTSMDIMHKSSNNMQKIQTIIADFCKMFDEWNTITDIDYYKCVNIVWFVVFCQEWMHLHSNMYIPNYDELDSLYTRLKIAWTESMIHGVCKMYSEYNDVTAQDIFEELVDHVLSDVRMYGSFGAALKSIYDTPPSDIPF